MNRINMLLFVSLACAIAPASAMQRAVTSSRALVRPASNMTQRGYAVLTERERSEVANKLWKTQTIPDMDSELSKIVFDHEDLQAIYEKLDDNELNPRFIRSNRLNHLSDFISLGTAGLCVLAEHPTMGMYFLMQYFFLSDVKPNPSDFSFDQETLNHLKKRTEDAMFKAAVNMATFDYGMHYSGQQQTKQSKVNDRQ